MNAPGLSAQAVVALARALREPGALPGRHIGAKLRELVILHVSSVNGCPVCSAVHRPVARLAGVDAASIRAARACHPPAELDEPSRVALRYAELRTLGREDEDRPALERFERAFTDDEQREIRAVADLFTFTNRFNNTWERLVPGARRRRERMGLCEPAG